MKIRKKIRKESDLIALGITNRTANQSYYLTAEQETKLQTIRENNKFERHCKTRGIDTDTVHFYWDKTKEYSIKVDMPAAQEVTPEQFVDSIISKIKSHVPIYKKIPTFLNDGNNLLVIDIADAHFGKLATAYETGEEYNINIAKQRCYDGVAGIVSKARPFGIDKIMFVIGNDVLHYDNPRRTTTSGTPQDSDGMFYDMFNAALEVYVRIIEQLRMEFCVDIIFNASNHDYMSGWMLARTIGTWFKDCDNVTVDDKIGHRKYYQYGANLIGTTHGDGAKMADLPLLMANEAPVMWASTKYRHVYCHHIHHKQTNKFQSGKDYIGVTVEYLRSPSEADSWHHRNGYTGSKKAIEGFIHHIADGQVARISHYF